jgi:formylglycine-generating enzyme required for sulfatase activity
VQIRPGAATRLAWAPATRPKLPAGMRLRWVPAEPGFWLAEVEVTVKQYATFLADPAVAERLRASWKAYHADTNAPLALLPRQGAAPDEAVWQLEGTPELLNSWRPNKDALAEPVRGVSRDDALAYCRWLSQQSGAVVRLPTLAEWRFAATGGDDRRVHPWGPGFDHALASSAVPPKKHPQPVGSVPSDRGPFGHRDLAGSVREWVSDPGLAYDARIAGGAWTDEDPARLRSDSVESLQSSASFSAIGFRILVQP